MNINNQRRDYFLLEGFMPDNFCDDDIGVQKIEKSPLGPNDVICGRCSTAFNNVGNRQFRAIIGLNVPKYLEAETRVHKSRVIESTVSLLKNEIGARFFKLKAGKFVEVDNNKHIRQKVGHALRDMAVQKTGEPSSSTMARRRSSSSAKSSSSIRRLNSDKSLQDDNSISSSTKSQTSEMFSDASRSLGDDHYLEDDLSVEEVLPASPKEIFPDIEDSEPTQQEIFGKMVATVDNLNSLFDIDDDFELFTSHFVAKKVRF